MKYHIIVGVIVLLIIFYINKHLIMDTSKKVYDFAADEVIKFVIKMNEGGYVNDAKDPGGETNFGISKRSYPNLNIKNLTIDKAIEIYKEDYFKPILTLGLTNPNFLYQVLDMAINAGPKTALKLYKGGTFVFKSGNLSVPAAKTIEDYKRNRLSYYKKLAGWKDYATSWTNRVNRNFI